MTGGEEEFQLQLVIERHTYSVPVSKLLFSAMFVFGMWKQHSLCREDIGKKEPMFCLLVFCFRLFPLFSADTNCLFLLLPLEATPLLAFGHSK